MLQPRTKLQSVSPEEVELDEIGCLSLSEIIKCLNAPINEEHAWALIYQSLRALDLSIKDNAIRHTDNANHQFKSNEYVPLETKRHKILGVLSTEDILIQEDGVVHHNTWCSCGNHTSNRPIKGKNCKPRKRGRTNRPCI